MKTRSPRITSVVCCILLALLPCISRASIQDDPPPAGTTLVCLVDDFDPSKTVQVVTFDGSGQTEFILPFGGAGNITTSHATIKLTGTGMTIDDAESSLSIHVEVNNINHFGSAGIVVDHGFSYSVVDSDTTKDSCVTPGGVPANVLALTINAPQTVTAPAEVSLTANASIVDGTIFYWQDNGALISVSQNATLVIYNPGVHNLLCTAVNVSQMATASATVVAK